MTGDLLYINGELLDLAPDSQPIRVNLKAHEIGELSTVWVSYTSSFVLPFTPNNDRLLAYARDSRTSSDVPYKINKAKLVRNGIELITDGALVFTVIKEHYEVSLYEINADSLYTLINNKYITEIETSDVGAWDNTFINSKRNSTSGVCCPVLDYGKTTTGPIDIKLDYYLPSFSYKTIIEAILDNAGFDSTRRSLSFYDPADTYGRLVLPFGRDKWEYSRKFTDKRSFYASTGPQTITMAGGGDTKRVYFTLPRTGFNDLGWYDNSSQYNVPAKSYDTPVQLGARLNFTLSGKGGGDTLTMRLNYNGTFNPQVIAANGTYNQGNGVSVYPSLAGDTMYVDFVSTGPSALTIDITSGEFHAVVDTVPYGSIYYPALLPEIKQADMMRDFITRYFLSSYERRGSVYFKSFEKIIGDRSTAVDLSAKHDVSIQDWQYFKGLNYAQLNKFNYADGLLGGGSFSINNVGLPLSQDVINSVFSSSPLSDLGGINSALVQFYDSTSASMTDFKNKPGPTLLLLRDAKATDPTVKYNGTTRTDYQVAYFVDPAFPDLPSMEWDYFIDLNAASLVAALQKMKLIYRYYNLTELDVQAFNFHRLVFDQDTYFLANSVDDFIPKKPARLQLLKL